MFTYTIKVTKTVEKEISVNAMTLEEAKEKAIRKSLFKPDENIGSEAKISAMCKEFLPFDEKSA